MGRDIPAHRFDSIRLPSSQLLVICEGGDTNAVLKGSHSDQVRNRLLLLVVSVASA